MSRTRVLFFVILFLASSLACRAATRLIEPDTPAPLPPSLTPTATFLPVTPTPEAACPDETASVLEAVNQPGYTTGNFPNVDTGNKVDLPLVIYTVNGDQLSDPLLETVPRNLRKYQSDIPTQQKAWELFTALIPVDQRQMLAEYQVITDGAGEILAVVEQTPENPDRWILEIDIADMADTKNLVFTLLHEFGHLLTLNSSQVPPDLKIFKHPESDLIYNQEVSACPNFFPGEGCSLPGSYLNNFFDRFWRGLYEEWQTIDGIQNDSRRQAKLDEFFQKYKDQFVDDYAVTDVTEDIAETWAYFLLSPRPQGDTIADQKLLFFYQYPELVQVREQILQNLCKVQP
jgi:hypothetical protein